MASDLSTSGWVTITNTDEEAPDRLEGGYWAMNEGSINYEAG